MLTFRQEQQLRHTHTNTPTHKQEPVLLQCAWFNFPASLDCEVSFAKGPHTNRASSSKETYILEHCTWGFSCTSCSLCCCWWWTSAEHVQESRAREREGPHKRENLPQTCRWAVTSKSVAPAAFNTRLLSPCMKKFASSTFAPAHSLVTSFPPTQPRPPPPTARFSSDSLAFFLGCVCDTLCDAWNRCTRVIHVWFDQRTRVVIERRK